MSQKKMGRPPSKDPKDTMFRVRLNDESMEKLKDSSKKLNITLSDVVRKGIDMVYDDLKKGK